MYAIVKNELYHHGILGQRWGVRRFQNPDGTLTEAGKERYFRGGKQGVPDGTFENSAYGFTKEGYKVYKKELKKQLGITDDHYWEQLNKIEPQEEISNFELPKEQLLKKISDLEKTEHEEWTKLSKLMASGEVFTKNFFEQERKAIASTERLTGAKEVVKIKDRLYRDAEKEDIYSLDYLERTPDNFSELSKKEQLADYQKWLNDPKTWREERYKH